MASSDLSPAQAAGLSCVVCSAPLDAWPAIPNVPVGRAAGTQVFACEARCAAEAGYVPPAQLTLTPPDDEGCPLGGYYCQEVDDR